MISDLLQGLLEANLALSAAILVAASLRGVVRRRFGARMAYGLWLAPPLAMLAVFVPRPEWMPEGWLAVTEHWQVETGQAAVALSGGAALPGLPVTDLLGSLWLVGMVLAVGLTLLAHRRGLASFGGLSLSGGVLRAARNGLGPAMIGIWRPRLVLPADFEARFNDREQALILAHEHHHKFSGDTRINGLVSLACCLNWFNPLVHIAAHLLRVDQELACDAAVVERFPGERRTYAEALLKSQLPCAPLPLGCTWPSGSQNLLQERLTMLAHKSLARPYRLAGGVLIGSLCLGTAAAAWAASGAISGSTSAIVLTDAPIAQSVETAKVDSQAVEMDPAAVTAAEDAVRSASTGAVRETAQYVRVENQSAPPATDYVCLSNSCSRPGQTISIAPATSGDTIEVVRRSLSGVTGVENLRTSSDEGGTNYVVEMRGRPASVDEQAATSSLREIVAVRVAN